jgi:hypothetical protein
MKFILALFCVLGFISSSYASTVCQNAAVRAAKEGSQFSQLYNIRMLPASKSYLESYEITFVDSLKQPKQSQTFDVITMKSDCDIVSLLRKF